MATYTIKKGDSLLQIAKRNGISYDSLLAANPGVKSGTVGVTLRIPTSDIGDDKFGQRPPRITIPPPPGIPREKFEQRPPRITIPPPPGIPREKFEQRPPRIQLPPQQPPQRPQYVPPAQSMAGLERSRVPQPPVVRVTGAQRPPPQQIQPGVGIGAGVIPGTFGGQAIEQFTQTTFPFIRTRVQGYLDRLFKREPVQQAPVVSFTGAQRPSQERERLEQILGWPPQAPQAAPAPRGDFYAETVRIANQLGISTTEATRLLEQQGTFAPPTVKTLETDPVSGFPVFEGGELGEHSSIIEWYLDNGLMPFSLYAEDVARFGWTDAELIAAGYIEDAYGNWIRVNMEPGEVERAAGGGGGGGGYYPRGGGGGGRRGGGGGGFAYPSYLPREAPQYPQSFVQRGQRGATPTGRSTRPARMGAITWRI